MDTLSDLTLALYLKPGVYKDILYYIDLLADVAREFTEDVFGQNTALPPPEEVR